MQKVTKRIISAFVIIAMAMSVCGSLLVMANDYQGHWAKADIEYLIGGGFIAPNTSGDVDPDGAMMRGAFVRLVNKIFKFSEKAEANFSDVAQGSAYYEDFLVAKKADYIKGDESGNANPEGTITRGEVAVILARLYKFDTDNIDKSKYNENDVPLWAMGSVAALDKAGIMKGNEDGTFSGYKQMTNAEGYTMAARMGRKANDVVIPTTNELTFTAPPAVVHNPPAVSPGIGQEVIIKVYDKQVKFDIIPTVENGKIWVSAPSVLELMNFDFVPTEAGFIIKNEWSNAEITIGSDTAKLNGNDIKIEKPYKNNIRYWMSLDDIMRVTNSTYTWDDANNAAVIQAPVLPTARAATAQDIVITPQFRTSTYIIPLDDPSANITVWTLAKTSGNEGWRKGQDKWWKEYSPVYVAEKKGYLGTLTYLDEDVDNKVRVRIIKNGVEDIFEADYHSLNAHNRTLQDLAYDAKQLTLVSTFCNISVYLNSPVDASTQLTNTVMYKEKGTDAWKYAFRLDYDKNNNQFRGSIVQLKEGATYEVKVTLKDAAGAVVKEETAETTMWSEDVPIAKTIDIKDIYTPGKNIVLQNVHGSENGWIKIVGDGKTVIDVSDEYWEAIFIAQSEYLILDGLTIKGAYRHGINIVDQSKFIRINNCDISGWGREGILDEVKGHYRDHTGAYINNEAGVYINDVSNTVIERCYIHDPRGRSNAWSSGTWKSVHPMGPNGIYGRSRERVIIRYNDFIGSDDHRWNDAIESYHNFDKWGGFACDSDIYGNLQLFGQDDSTETDGSQMNMRYFGNKVEGFLCGVSTACTTDGPSYYFRNLILNLGDDIGKYGGAVKNGQTKKEWTGGFSHFFHNTFMGQIAQTSGYYLTYARNNIMTSARNDFDDPGISFDYDLTKSGVTGPLGSEANGITGEADFVDKLAADFRLVAGSLGIDKGQNVPNFSEGFSGDAPDMGAIELGSDTMIPIRPIKIRSDKYQLNLLDKTPETVTFKIGDVPAGTTYKIMKNNVFGWINIDGATEGTITPNSELKLTVSGVPENVKFVRQTKAQLKKGNITGIADDLDKRIGNGAFILKLSNGDSIPVTVYLKKS